MAITKKLKDEADRTIVGITKYYDQCGDTLLDADEREHRIDKIESALEGCNGITEKEKIQKTAENLFGLTCSMERDFLALKRELKINQDKTQESIESLKTDLADTKVDLKKIGNSIISLDKRFENLCLDIGKMAESPVPRLPYKQTQEAKPDQPRKDVPWYAKCVLIIDKHFGTAMTTLIILAILIILSGNLNSLNNIFHPNCIPAPTTNGQ